MGDKNLRSHDDKTWEMQPLSLNGRPRNMGRISRNNFMEEAVCHGEGNEKSVLHTFSSTSLPHDPLLSLFSSFYFHDTAKEHYSYIFFLVVLKGSGKKKKKDLAAADEPNHVFSCKCFV